MGLTLIKRKALTFNYKDIIKKNRISLKEACKELDELGVQYEIKNFNHIRIENINFYLSTGTCYIDGTGSSYKNKGIEFLKDLIRKGQSK